MKNFLALGGALCLGTAVPNMLQSEPAPARPMVFAGTVENNGFIKVPYGDAGDWTLLFIPTEIGRNEVDNNINALDDNAQVWTRYWSTPTSNLPGWQAHCESFDRINNTSKVVRTEKPVNYLLVHLPTP